MREPHAFAQRNSFQDAVSVSGHERDADSDTGADSLPGFKPNSDSRREPDSVALDRHLP
jgi:hypothetical protein